MSQNLAWNRQAGHQACRNSLNLPPWMARQMQISLSSLSVCGRMGDLAHLLKLRWVFLQEIPGLSALTFKRGLTKGSISQASPVPVFTKRTPQSLNFHPQAPQIPGSGESSSLKLEVEEWELCCGHHTPRITHTFYMTKHFHWMSPITILATSVQNTRFTEHTLGSAYKQTLRASMMQTDLFFFGGGKFHNVGFGYDQCF